MCGISGVVDLAGTREIDRTTLERMTDLQQHRGPDGRGFHYGKGIGLGHRRLSIIDVAGGAQPIYNEDRTVAVTYNGEIYNYQGLMGSLVASGHSFETKSDTEVIVHGWEQWGESCVEKFNGMFAFAVWDDRQKTIFLARDRLGIKPLYYAVTKTNYLVFGSELKAILAFPDISRELDPEAIEEYFTLGYVSEPRSILMDVRKLPPGHTLKLERGQLRAEPRQYWDVSFDTSSPTTTAQEEELASRLKTAVEKRLMSEVPLGAFLSGGVDSSSVVAMMASLSGEPVKTCAIAFGEKDFDESRFAEQVANSFNTEHTVRRVDPSDFSLLDELVDVYDEPFADSSAIPTYRVCETARAQVTVALSGDGGDENFAGYRRHRWHMVEERVRRQMPDAIRRPLFGLVGALYPKLDWAPRIFRAKATLQGIARDSLEGYLHSVSILPTDMGRTLFSRDFDESLDGYRAVEVFRRHASNGPTHPLSKIQYIDLKTYLPGDILTKVDRASMAHSLEVRVPLLDHEFVEWVATLDPSWKLRGREGKYILKRAMTNYLDHGILYRDKMGFGVPLAYWFRGPLKDRLRESVLGPSLAEIGVFNMDTVKRLVEQHQAGIRDYSAVLWALLMFVGFLRRATH